VNDNLTALNGELWRKEARPVSWKHGDDSHVREFVESEGDGHAIAGGVQEFWECQVQSFRLELLEHCVDVGEGFDGRRGQLHREHDRVNRETASSHPEDEQEHGELAHGRFGKSPCFLKGKEND